METENKENKIEKNDFIELEYIGRIKDDNIFDTNIKEEAKKINLEIETRPLIICIGQGMILPAIDDFLTGQSPGKYTLELEPEKAFGKRQINLIKTMPLKVFIEKDILPKQGMVFSFDNLLGKITAISGGRVIVDFNNPLAGKKVVYELNIKRKILDLNEKINSLIYFFFKRKLEFEINEKRLLVSVDKEFKPILELFKPKFKEILNLELETSESLDSDSTQKSKISDIKEVKEIKQHPQQEQEKTENKTEI